MVDVLKEAISQFNRPAWKQEQVIISKRSVLVRDAQATAEKLHCRLAIITEVMDLQILNDVQKGKYTLLIDSKGLPKKAGWYHMLRIDGIHFQSLSETEAKELRREKHWYEPFLVPIEIPATSIRRIKNRFPVMMGYVDFFDGNGITIYGNLVEDFDRSRIALVKLKSLKERAKERTK